MRKRNIVIKSPWTGKKYLISLVNEPIEPNCENCGESFPKCCDCKKEIIGDDIRCGGEGNHLCIICYNRIKKRVDGYE